MKEKEKIIGFLEKNPEGKIENLPSDLKKIIEETFDEVDMIRKSNLKKK